MPDFQGPDQEYGGGKPECYRAADGSLWWGTLAKRGGVLKLIIYRSCCAKCSIHFARGQ